MILQHKELPPRDGSTECVAQAQMLSELTAVAKSEIHYLGDVNNLSSASVLSVLAEIKHIRRALC